MEKTVKILFAIIFLLLGVIIGFLWSPVKRGVYCGNHNGNSYGGNELGYDPDEWDDCDEDDEGLADDGEDDMVF